MSFHYKAHNDFYNYLCDDYRTHTTPVKKDTNVKELTLQDLDDGIIITMPDNSRYKLQRTNFTIDISEWSDVFNKLKITLEGCPQPIIREQENIMKKDFSKADLRTGMKVVLRNKMKYIVLLDVDGVDLLTNRDFGLMSFYNYHENLKCGSCFEWDIVEVYRAHNNSLALDTQTLGKLIWKREEKSPEQLAYEQLQAQIVDEETRHNESMKSLREQAEKLKPKA